MSSTSMPLTAQRRGLVTSVPSGYRETRLGILPEDWDSATIGELAVIKTGGRDTKDRDDNGSYPFFVRSQKVERINSYSFEGEAVLTAGDGVGTGKVFHYTQGKFDCHQRVYRISNFTPKLNGKYFFYYFSAHFYRRIMSMTAKSSVDSVRMDMISQMFVPLPSLQEQALIAGALSDVDALMGALDKLVAKKRAIKLAAMQQLLTGRTRLSGFHGDWSVMNLASTSILKARIGWQGLTTAEYRQSGGYFLVSGTDFQNGRVAWPCCCFVDRSRYEQDRHIQLRDGDILLTKDGTIGKVAFVDELPGPATLNSGVFVIRPKNGAYDPRFLYYLLVSRVFDNFLARLQAGSTIVHLYQKDFTGFTFHAPGFPEQRAIARVLSDMDAEIAALERRRDKTKAIKQGMMQALLTGRVRLVKAEAAG